MSHSQLSTFEVTRSVSDCARAAGFDFGADTALVAVQHMLQQTVDLFRTASGMGLSLKNIFTLGKIYSNNDIVIRTLRELAVTVVETTTPTPGEFHSYFERDIDRLWQVIATTLRTRGIKRLLILDDGGVCLTRVPAEILQQYEVCGVEQTSSGIFLFEQKPPPFAVMSWARSAVKLEIGGRIFSQWLIETLHAGILRGRSLQSERLGIIGLGSIGRGVANLLLKHGNEVLFYDPDPELYVPRSLRNRIARLDSLEELMLQCDYVLGCSGRNPFKGKWPLKHRPGIKLISASSGDEEFGPIIRDLKQQPDFKVAADTWDIISDNGPCGPIHISYLGYPYSFVTRSSEAVPTRIVQFDTGGLLTALIQARLFLELCESTLQPNSGIHRLTPQAQRFVYEKWARVMKERINEYTGNFNIDPELLSAALYDDWFIEKTEPRPGERYTPVRAVEETMSEFVYPNCRLVQVGG
jgi:hypothetical protein